MRAYSLFVRAYDQCRRAVSYLRWEEGDADDEPPSLFANRGPRKAPAETGAPGVLPVAAPGRDTSDT